MPLSAAAVTALLLAAAVTIGALVWTVVVLARRLRSLGGDLERLQRDLAPTLAQLQADAEVVSAEMQGLTERLDGWATERERRPPRRWRVPR